MNGVTRSPAVSVVIPTYNHRAYVLETLASVFAQTFADYEVVVVNDGSPDDTAEVVRPLAEAGRIRYIEQPNAGVAAARNRGIAEARGEFIALLDDDDVWPADKLAWQVAELDDRPDVDFVVGGCAILGRSPSEVVTVPPADATAERFRAGNWVHSPGQTLVRRSALARVGGFDPSIWGADDWELYIRLAICRRAVYRHRVALHYRYHETNASTNYWRLYTNCRAVYLRHVSGLGGADGADAKARCRTFLRGYAPAAAGAGWRHLSAGRRRAAAREYLRCVRIDPRAFRSRAVVFGLLRSLAPRWIAGRGPAGGPARGQS